MGSAHYKNAVSCLTSTMCCYHGNNAILLPLKNLHVLFQKSRQVGKLMDLFPSLIEMAGAKIPEVELDGENINDILFNEVPQKDR